MYIHIFSIHGYPQDGGLYVGYNVIKDGEIIGFISVGGIFRNDANASLTEEEQIIIMNSCKKVYEMPSEYGCLGVGESPTTPFDESRLRETIAAR